MRHVFKLVMLSLAVTTACVTSPGATSEAVSTSTQASDLEAIDGTGATTQSVTCSQYWGCDPVCPASGYTNTLHEICFENGSAISDQIILVRHCTEVCF